MPLALYGSTGFKFLISAAILDTNSLSTPFILTSKSDIFGKFFISIAGIFSIALGLALGSDLIFETEFTSFLWY